MLDFLKKNRRNRNKELDAIIQKMQMNIANNYKDAAQINLREFEKQLKELKDGGKLNDSQVSCYEEELASFQQRMKQFTHKDQKPTWV